MSYIGNSPGVASQRVETAFTATASQTVFTPSSGYTLGYCDVYYNGVKLVNGDDYTASDGVSITLATAAAAGDSVVVVASFPRGLSDGYLKAEADARFLGLSAGGNVTGNVGLNVAPNHRLDIYDGSGAGAQVIRNQTTHDFTTSGVPYTRMLGFGVINHNSGSTRTSIPVSSTAWKNSSYGAYIGSWMDVDTSSDGSTNAVGYLARLGGSGSNSGYIAYQGDLTGVSGTGVSKYGVVVKGDTDNSLDGNLAIGGNLVLASGKGIDFSASSNASGMTGEVLDDYEHGTWTPTINLLGTLTYSNRFGRYQKIGKFVHVSLSFSVSSSDTTQDGTSMQITGLPFTSASISGSNYENGAFLLATEAMRGTQSPTAQNTFFGLVDAGATTVSVVQNNYNATIPGKSWYGGNRRDGYIGGTMYVLCQFRYEVA